MAVTMAFQRDWQQTHMVIEIDTYSTAQSIHMQKASLTIFMGDKTPTFQLPTLNKSKWAHNCTVPSPVILGCRFCRTVTISGGRARAFRRNIV
nr:hypothetical protein Iba_chr04aCG5190 [Ipomoea batatas]GMC83844.1 hypothetical protein Iba_chr04cCG5980 [Ipomoea batatas]